MEPLKQYKCLTDLRDYLSAIENYRARPIIEGQHPTLYKEELNGKYRTVMGIRICDFQFSNDEKWVLPHPQMGPSFSSTWSNLKFVHGMPSKRSKGKESIDVYWLLSEADIPPGLKFEEDKTNPSHYFLTVTEKMLTSQLVTKLRLVSYRMSVIRDGSKVL